MKIAFFLEDIIQEYNLRNKVDATGNVHCEVQRGMYGLPQAGIIAQELLEERLLKAGYRQSKVTPGYWKHDLQPISFTLVMDNFGIKYINKIDVNHLIQTLQQDYEIEEDWEGTRYLSITLDWDYKKREVHLSMPGTLNEHLPDLDILSPTYFNINRTSILFLPTEPQFNTPKMTMPQNFFLKRRKSTSNKFLALFSTTAKQWIQQCSPH